MFLRLITRFCFVISLIAISNLSYAKQITFDLEDIHGKVTQESYPGKYLLLAVGYTSCPDICPTTLYEYGLAMKAIKHPEKIVPIFVSIDPVNDTAESMHAYTSYFDERIVGLTGKMENIKDLAKQLGATFGYRLNGKKVDIPTKGTSYTVYHSALIYLINPNHELVDVYDYQIGDKGLTEALDKALSDNSSPEKKAMVSSADTSLPKEEKAVATSTPATTATASNVENTHTDTTLNQQQACELPKGFTEHKQDILLKDVYPQAKDAPVALVNLWALWCAPCRIELPILNNFASTEKNMPLYTINLGDKEEDINKLFADQKLSALNNYSVKGLSLLRQLGGKGLPFNALFIQGKQIAIKNGIIEETESLKAYAQCIIQTK
ncbi:SCO family protein [Pelistega sp. MC2]|uniref:SCO family protein n=1 Tax=Pelistega sp. MC2 TaxID=1720297 RepID=UPI0008D9A955|nr:SCO family protein [Pelistega sp. MC2]